MSKPRRIWMSVAIVAAVSLAALVTLNRSREPRYNGRTVSEWISDVGSGGSVSGNQQIRLMLAALGSNAIPPLLANLTADDAALSQLMRWTSKSTLAPSFARAWAVTNLARTTWRVQSAAQALELLGPKASPATLQLERLALKNSLPGHVAVRVLEKIGQSAVPSLVRLLTDAPPHRRILIVGSLERIFRGIEDAEGPLIGLLNDPDKRVRIFVAVTLSKLRTPPQQAIPALAEALGLQHEGYWHEAIRALELYAPEHPEALVAIREASKSVDPSLRRLAEDSLWRMAHAEAQQAKAQTSP
jgi:HEAT repeat protein